MSNLASEERDMDVQASSSAPVPRGGWAGVAFHESSQVLAATHQLARSVWWIDPVTMQETGRRCTIQVVACIPLLNPTEYVLL